MELKIGIKKEASGASGSAVLKLAQSLLSPQTAWAIALPAQHFFG